MNKIQTTLYRFICGFFCFLLIFTMLPARAAAADTDHTKVIRVGWSEDAYYTTGENGKRSGYGYEFQQDIAAYTGWTYEYVKADFIDLLEMLQNGEIDMMGGVSYTEERAETMLFSDLPMGQERYYVYADLTQTDISASDLTTLNGKRIGVLESGVPSELFRKLENRHNLSTQHVNISSEEDTLQKIRNGEIDGFVSIEAPRWEREGLSPVAAVGSSDIYFVINKNHPELKEQLDNAMRRIEHDQPFYTDDLYKQYLSAKSLEMLSDEEQTWLAQHGAVRIGYLKSDIGVSLVDAEGGAPVGILNDYIDYASNGLGDGTIRFTPVGFDTQNELLQALKDHEIDMIFHMNDNPYEAEQNDIALSNTVFEVNIAVLTNQDYFDENAQNTVAVSKGNLLSNWYISHYYPQWKIQEYDSTADVEAAVKNGEADCFIVKAGQLSKSFENSKMRSVFLTKMSDSSFAVNRNDTTLLSILNKTLKMLPSSKLSGAYSMYENISKKVTWADFIKDNLFVVSIVFLGLIVLVLTVILKLLQEARKAQIQAENANAAKSNFLFNMSHDIRTPMNAILGYNELMKKELTDPKLLDYQEKIEQSGNLLLSIINNVLDMARIESGKVELDESYTSVADIQEKIVGVFEMEAKKKGLRFIHEVQVEHQHIMCDVTKVQEIFVNLVSNAVKYTPSGGTVTIRSLEIPSKRDGTVCIKTEVTDTGIGMSREFLPSLFEAFARERNTTTGKIAGTGLGMPIVKKYVDMMGGSIDVKSELGKGTQFTVVLSYRMADKVYYEQKTAKPSQVDIKELICGKHILLAEDNDLNAEIAVTILEDMGLVVERVKDGIQCVSKMEHKPAGSFDLILMDIQMPNMNGYKATQAIRRLADRDKANIPIIAMTANAFEEDRKQAIRKGMNGHIAKPISMKQIENVLLSILESS